MQRQEPIQHRGQQIKPAHLPRPLLKPAGVRVFLRVSGKPLSDGIPGFLTIKGFHKLLLLRSLGSAAKGVASESWVLGKRTELDPNGPEMRGHERDMIALYSADYAGAWDKMLADLDVVPRRSLSRAAQDLYILSSPQSPMRDVLASAARQLTLSVPLAPPTTASGVAAAAAQTAAAATQAAANSAGSRLQAFWALPPTNPPCVRWVRKSTTVTRRCAI